MDAEDYINHKKELSNYLYQYIENDDDTNSFSKFVALIENHKYRENKKEFGLLLSLIFNIFDCHKRTTDFSHKFEKIITTLLTDIKQLFSNWELFCYFNYNKLLLLTLFEKKIITVDSDILNFFTTLKDKGYMHYFLPEIEASLSTYEEQTLKREIGLTYLNNVTNYDDFYKKRKTGENDSYICSIIRDDNIDEFVTYISRTNLSLTSQIESSIYETNSFLLKNEKPTLIQYSAFFGSIQIFNFLLLNNVELNYSILPYAIHGNNPDIIHKLEENKVLKSNYFSLLNCLRESIKCHHNDIVNYFLNNYVTNEHFLEKNDNIFNNFSAFGFEYQNYEFISTDSVYAIYYLIKYDYIDLAEALLKYKNTNSFDKYLTSPLSFAANLDKIGFYDLLLKKSTKIDNNTFMHKSITELIIPHNITSIENQAFCCSNLKRIEIPSSVYIIGRRCFDSCSSLECIKFETPSLIKVIDEYFCSRTKIKEIEIPASVELICSFSFFNCSYLKKVTILSSSVTLIGNYAFSGCSLLKEINIPSSVTKIGDYAFNGCSLLKEINIPSSVTSIGNYAFNGCSLLKEINIPSSVTKIGDYVFSGCSLLKEINIPSSVTKIGDYAFSGCSSLKEINIPSSVTSIGNYAFYHICSLGKITISSSVISIGNYAFSGCSSLKEINITSSVISIGNYAFSGCSSLKEINITSSVISIGKYAFYSCTNLIKATIPFVKEIEDGTFCMCNSLRQVSLPLVDFIKEDAFYECISLKEIDISNAIRIGRFAFKGCTSLEEISLPSIVKISQFAFASCSKLTNVNLSPFTKFIGGFSFRNCISLKSFSIPETLITYGKNIFDGCLSLTKITIPNSVNVKKIGINSDVQVIRITDND